MGRLYKRGDTWWGDYRDAKGIRYRETLRTGDVKVARERLRQRELAGPADRAAHGTLGAALTYFVDTACAGKAKGTVSCYRQKARHLVRLLGSGSSLASIERAQVQQYHATRLAEGAAQGTVYKELVVLRRALAERGIDGIVPRISAGYVPRTRFLEPAQLAIVLGHLAEKRRLWVVAATFTGMRDSEINRLAWEDVDLERGWIRVRGTKTAGSFRAVPIAKALLPWLKAVQPEPATGPVVENWTNRRRAVSIAYWKMLGLKVPDYRKKESSAGMPRLSPNDLRRTFASWMKQAGVDSLAVAHLLGHSSTRMVDLVYGRLTGATYKAAVATLPRCDTGVPPRGSRKTRKSAAGTASIGASGGFAVPRGGIEPPTRGFSGPVLAVLPGGKHGGKRRVE